MKEPGQIVEGGAQRLRQSGLLVVAVLMAGFLSVSLRAETPAESKEAAVLDQIQLLNQIPEDQLNEKIDPAFSVLKKIYDLESPDFMNLRKLLGRAEVRKTLNPSAKAVFAGIISQRWDSFSLSGNLYLAGLQSKSSELRERSKQKLINFIQPAHIPVLITLLSTPGPNVLALDVLHDTTHRNFGPDQKAWRAWWQKSGATADLVGLMLKDTKERLAQMPVAGIDQEKFWYVPEGISHAGTPFAERSDKEKDLISRWTEWANGDVKRFVDDWAQAKPILDRIKHQPDPRVNAFFEHLVGDPGMGDYASVVLAWRGSRTSLQVLQEAYARFPSVGRALGRGTLGDQMALPDLLGMIEKHQAQPLSYGVMDDTIRLYIPILRQVGVVPAEQAFELLAHHRFDFDGAMTGKDKRKACKAASRWLSDNAKELKLDRRRGFYVAK